MTQIPPAAERVTQFNEQLAIYGIDAKELQKNQEINASTFLALNLPTPPKFVKERPARGGGKWKYIEGSYVIDRLNMIFGLAWSFEVAQQWQENGYALVRGHLIINLPNGGQIKRPGSGGKEITYLKKEIKDVKTGEVVRKEKTNELLDLGNDYAAAETAAIKRAARTLGIGLDLYSDELSSERRLLAASAKRESGIINKAAAAREAAKNNVLGENQ